MKLNIAQPMYLILCDSCRKFLQVSDRGGTLYPFLYHDDPVRLQDAMTLAGWERQHERHYCPDCKEED